MRPTLAARERRFALALLLPALAVLLLTTTAPLVYLAWNSLHRIDLGMPWLSGFAGLDNYARMGSDPRFWNSLVLTAVYTASTVALQVVLGLSLALLVLQIPKGQGVLRVAAILPIVLAPVVVGLFWRTLVLAPDFGLVDLVTRSLGLGSHNWLGDPQLALVSVIAIHTWQWTPFAFLVILATLATLPPDVYEAARLDRAGAWQRFRHITLPLIRPAIVMVVILRTMTALSAFAAIFAATGGGPGSATEILNLYAYRTSFTTLRKPRLRRVARGRRREAGAAGDHSGHLVADVPAAHEAGMSGRRPPGPAFAAVPFARVAVSLPNPCGGTRGRRCPAGAISAAASSAGPGSARAQPALRGLTRRRCLSAVSEANVASSATRPRAEQRSGVGAQRRPPQHEPLPGAACRDPQALHSGRNP